MKEKTKNNEEIFDRNGITGGFQRRTLVEDELKNMNRPLSKKEEKMINDFLKEREKVMKFYDMNGKEFTNGCLVLYNEKKYDLSISTSGIHLINTFEEITLEAKFGTKFENIKIIKR